MREYHRSGCYKPYRIKVAQPVRLNLFHASGTPSSKDAKSKPKKTCAHRHMVPIVGPIRDA
jgi:hypothetical protein